MLEKTIKASNIENLVKTSEVQPEVQQEVQPEAAPAKPVKDLNFPAGTKFSFNDRTYRITKEIREPGTNWRHMLCITDGSEEVLELHTLVKDSQSPTFFFMETTEAERILAKIQVP